MTNRIDNLQLVLDRIDWRELATHKLGLMIAIDSAKRLGREETAADMQAILNFLNALEDAAEMDGYQVNAMSGLRS